MTRMGATRYHLHASSLSKKLRLSMLKGDSMSEEPIDVVNKHFEMGFHYFCKLIPSCCPGLIIPLRLTNLLYTLRPSQFISLNQPILKLNPN